MKWMEGIGPGDVIYVFVSTGRGVGMLYGPFEAEGTAELRITDRLPPSFPAHIRFKQPTRLEVNHIYTCFPPGPLTRSAITTAIESARAPGPSLSPSPSPRRDASTRPLRESNRSPVPVIVTPQKSPRPSPSSRQDDSGLEKLQDENKVLKDQLATQACMPQRSPQIGGPRLIIISTQNKHTVRAGPGAVSRETGATHRDEYRTSHTRRPTSI